MLRDVLTFLFLLNGTVFMLIAGLGILRMPDLFLRMSMTTKASTIGVGSMLVGCMFYFADGASMAKSFAVIIFILLTSPVSAHMIGRAGYRDKDVNLWPKTHTDQLQEIPYQTNNRHVPQ